MVNMAADKTIRALMNIVKDSSQQLHILNQAAITFSEILRKYPKKWGIAKCVQIMVSKIDLIQEPESLAAIIWMLGEYSLKIPKSIDILKKVTTNFKDYEAIVQKQILTCSVKMFLRKPTEMEEVIAEVLETSTEEVENPDIRDRGYIYWRLLSEYPDETKEIVLSDKPTLKSNKVIFDSSLVENLIDNIGMISAVFHQ